MSEFGKISEGKVDAVPVGPDPCPTCKVNLEDGNTPTGECLDCVRKHYAESESEAKS